NHIRPTLNDFGEPGLSRLCLFDLVTCFFQCDPQQPADLLFTVDDEGAPKFHAVASILSTLVTRTGNLMVKRAPPPSRFSTVSLPPWASINPRAIDKPSQRRPG